MLKDFLTSDHVIAVAGGATRQVWRPHQVGEGRAAAPHPVAEHHDPAPKPEESPPHPGVRQRRREPRYLAIENRLWLQWWEDEDYLGRSARLVNVSRNGAMIVSWFLLRKDQRLRVYLEDPAPQIGVDASVLGVVEGITGMHQIRLEFISGCPEEFIEAAANGFETWLAGKRPGY